MIVHFIDETVFDEVKVGVGGNKSCVQVIWNIMPVTLNQFWVSNIHSIL